MGRQSFASSSIFWSATIWLFGKWRNLLLLDTILWPYCSNPCLLQGLERTPTPLLYYGSKGSVAKLCWKWKNVWLRVITEHINFSAYGDFVVLCSIAYLIVGTMSTKSLKWPSNPFCFKYFQIAPNYILPEPLSKVPDVCYLMLVRIYTKRSPSCWRK